jgi:protein-S-isoprenylcysteine O-methyltransferase Ste14
MAWALGIVAGTFVGWKQGTRFDSVAYSIAIALAWSVATSPWALITWATLPIFFTLKARLEEQFLTERFPEYRDYVRGVGRRFLPYVW